MELKWTRKALADLTRLHEFLAPVNRQAAARAVQALAKAPTGPELAFPPDGAEIEANGPLPLKVRGGTPPFTWLANGAPVILADRARETAMPTPGAGFLNLSVIDAMGQSATAKVTLRP